jgi:hypothetical protein
MLARTATAPAPQEGKILLEPAPEGVSQTPGRLTTAYVLSPVPELPRGAVVERERLTAVRAALALVTYARIAPLVSGGDAARLFSLAAELASRVKVFELRVVRDLQRIREVASALAAWHVQDALVA